MVGRAESCRFSHVALRKESVDRNSAVMRQNPGKHVALRKESVDRNEILKMTIVPNHTGVALRKESVDRNLDVLAFSFLGFLSLSARRAWIEMCIFRQARAS